MRAQSDLESVTIASPYGRHPDQGLWLRYPTVVTFLVRDADSAADKMTATQPGFACCSGHQGWTFAVGEAVVITPPQLVLQPR